MHHHHHRLLCTESWAPGDLGVLLEVARTLQMAASASATKPLLRGKNLGLMCESEASREAMLFRRSAMELGARVSHVRPSLSAHMPPAAYRQTAQMLGRLYDALECQDMAPDVIALLDREAGVPVYRGVACDAHPTAGLAELLGPGTCADDGRRFIVQAVLLRTLG